jgi:hypothetical protein
VGEVSRHARARRPAEGPAMRRDRARQAQFLLDRIPRWSASRDQSERFAKGSMSSIQPKGGQHAMKHLIAIAFLALAVYVSLAPPIAFGDGTDPMPLCRKCTKPPALAQR